MRGAALTDTLRLIDVQAEPTGTSIFGDPEYDDDAPGVEVPCMVTPLDATEDEINRDVRLNRYSATFSIDAPVDGLKEVDWHGKRYRVIGEPKRFSSYRGSLDHYEVEIRREEG